MSMRLRLEFSDPLVTEDMSQLGLQKCWYEPLENTSTIVELASELVHRFCLEVESEAELQLSCDGFTLPQSGRLSLLRDADLVSINLCPKPLPRPQVLSIMAGSDPAGREEGEGGRGQLDVLKRCLVCYSKYNKDNQVYLSKMREHVGSHILWGDVDSSACGFCGQVGTCTSTLEKGTGKGILKPVSNCLYYYKFSNKAVHKTDKKTNKCTNAPVQCSACGAFKWKYDMFKHWSTSHGDMMANFPQDCHVLIEEREALTKRVKRKKLTHEGVLTVAAGGSMALPTSHTPGPSASAATQDPQYNTPGSISPPVCIAGGNDANLHPPPPVASPPAL